MFTARERSQLDVYGIWAVTRNQLHTDDSFTFNRMITHIKESVSHLPQADDEEEAALQAIKVFKHSVLLENKPHSWSEVLKQRCKQSGHTNRVDSPRNVLLS